MMPTAKKPRRFIACFVRVIAVALLLVPNAAEARLLQERGASSHAQASSPWSLWKELVPLIRAKDIAAARALIAGSRQTARLLHRELLFDAAAARLYGNLELPYALDLRPLLAEGDAEAVALEIKFGAWIQEPKPGVGLAGKGDGLEQIILLATVAQLRDQGKEMGDGAPTGTPRELVERALALAEQTGIELAVASFSATLSVYALREKRLADIDPQIGRSEQIWRRWDHPVGLFQAPLIVAYGQFVGEKWNDAAINFKRAAERAKALPALRAERVNAMNMLAAARRNLGEKDGVRDALTEALAEQPAVLAAAGDHDTRLKQSKVLADLQVQMAAALSALGRHAEAAEWYVRAAASMFMAFTRSARKAGSALARSAACLKFIAASSHFSPINCP